MTDREFARLAAFQFLQDIKEQFLSTYRNRWQTANAYAFNTDFQHVLAQTAEKINNNKDDKISKIRENIDSIKSVMQVNIEKVLERGEKIELLVDKSEILEQHAFTFKKSATAVKRKFWWQNVKMMLILALFILVIIYVILAAACGGMDIPKCRGSSSSSSDAPPTPPADASSTGAAVLNAILETITN